MVGPYFGTLVLRLIVIFIGVGHSGHLPISQPTRPREGYGDTDLQCLCIGTCWRSDGTHSVLCNPYPRRFVRVSFWQ